MHAADARADEPVAGPPPAAPVTPAVEPATSTSTSTSTPAVSPSSDIPVVALVVGGAGLVAVGFGTYFALRVGVHMDRASPHCRSELDATRCDATGVKERDAALLNEVVGLSLIGAGVGALLIGEILFVTGRSTIHAKSVALSHGAGLSLDTSW